MKLLVIILLLSTVCYSKTYTHQECMDEVTKIVNIDGSVDKLNKEDKLYFTFGVHAMCLKYNNNPALVIKAIRKMSK